MRISSTFVFVQVAPPPKTGRDANRRSSAKNSARIGVDEVFGSAPISTATPRPKPQDPFGMGNFSIPVNGNGDANPDYHNLGLLDKKIMEMKVIWHSYTAWHLPIIVHPVLKYY